MEILSRELDQRGWCRTKNLIALSCTVHPKAGCQSVIMADDRCCSLFILPGTDRREKLDARAFAWQTTITRIAGDGLT